MYRITTGMKMNSYRYNLMQSTNTLYNSMNRVDTHRKFNSYAESPAAATNAWRVRENMMDNDSYSTENDDTTTRYQTAWITMGSIKTDLEQYNGKTSIIRAANGATGEAKKQLGNVLGNTADTVIQAINSSKYGDEFVFGGTDGTSPPFSWDGKKLLYRGINITPPGMLGFSKKWNSDWGDLDDSTGIPKNIPEDYLTSYDDKWELDPNDTTGQTYIHTYKTRADDGTVTQHEVKGITADDKEWGIYFKNVGTLNEMSKEIQYADLGMGMKEDANGNIVDGTFFNNALPGINMLGYGVDNDGDSKNLALIFKEFDRVLDTVDEYGRPSEAEGGEERIFQLMDKFDAVCEFTLKGYSYVDTKAKFLEANGDNLTDQGVNLQEQRANLEQVDMADAIEQYMWDYTCYSAALKVGTQLLSESLLDYMR